MSTLARLRRGLHNPRLFLRQANRLYHRRLNTRSNNTGGVDIFTANWDNLLILDACRYDMFEQQSTLDGRLESRESRGSSTREFLRANFKGKTLHDTVYVTANPQFYRHRDWLETSFHAVIDVWKEDGWDETHRTVLPETMVDRTLQAAETYPNKRLLVHFIQPHYPFISDGENPFEDEQAFLKPDEAGSWDQVMTGKIRVDRDDVWRAYRANLDRTLPHVEELLEALDGRSVVTADHGNMVGERSRPIPIVEWGHPRGIYTEQLVDVPWLSIDGKPRDVSGDPPVDEREGIADSVVADRLEQLGYT